MVGGWKIFEIERNCLEICERCKRIKLERWKWLGCTIFGNEDNRREGGRGGGKEVVGVGKSLTMREIAGK